MVLSVLDLLPVSSASRPAEVIRSAEIVARAAEAAGFHRYWVAEHHNMPSIASSARSRRCIRAGSTSAWGAPREPTR